MYTTPDTSHLTFLLGVAVFAGTLAREAAKNRNRHVALWGVICFLAPIALVIIWTLPKLPPRMAAVPDGARAGAVRSSTTVGS